MVRPDRLTCASLVRKASSRSLLRGIDWSALMYAVILYLSTFRWMPDHAMNYWTMSNSEIISATELVTSVPSSAYHLLTSLRPHEVMSQPLSAALSHQIRGSTIRSKKRGERGSP